MIFLILQKNGLITFNHVQIRLRSSAAMTPVIYERGIIQVTRALMIMETMENCEMEKNGIVLHGSFCICAQPMRDDVTL